MRYRTYDTEFREARRVELSNAALAASEAVSGDRGMDILVTGSLSRGQVHHWSDLDLVVVRNGVQPDRDRDRVLREAVYDAVGHLECDVVFEEHVPDPLRRGMMGSLVAPSDLPGLAPLPAIETVYARLDMSLFYALRETEELADAYGRIAANGSGRPHRLVRDGALRALSAKTDFWLKKLAVFVDGGQSPWLDDGDRGDLADLLLRLSKPSDEPFARPAVVSLAGARTLYSLSVARSDPFSEDVDLPNPRKAIYDLERQRRLWKDLACGATTDGLDVPEQAAAQAARP